MWSLLHPKFLCWLLVFGWRVDLLHLTTATYVYHICFCRPYSIWLLTGVSIGYHHVNIYIRCSWCIILGMTVFPVNKHNTTKNTKNTISAYLCSVAVSPLALNISSPLGLENMSDYSMVSFSCLWLTFPLQTSITITFTVPLSLLLCLSTHDLTPPLSSTSLLWTGMSWVRKSAWDSAAPWWANPANTFLIWPCCLSFCSSALTPWPSRLRSSRPAATSPQRLENCVFPSHVNTLPHGDGIPYPSPHCVYRCLLNFLMVVSCFSPKCRTLIADFAIIVSILVFCAVDYVLSLDTPKLHVPTQIKVQHVSSSLSSLPLCTGYIWMKCCF